MKKKLLLFLLLAGSSPLFAQLAKIDDLNLSTFSVRTKSDAAELSLVPEKFKAHPEFGILPFTSPPSANCVELIDRRDAWSRYFVEVGSDGKHFYRQQAYSPINYKDEQGRWRELNYRLEADAAKARLYHASHQPTPFTIDLQNRILSVTVGGKEFYFDEGLELLHQDENGQQTPLGTPDWSHFTAGDDGIRILDFYPGIDAVFSVKEAKLETSFILRSAPAFNNGWIVMKQAMRLPAGFRAEQEVPDHSPVGSASHIHVLDENRLPYLVVEKCFAYDNNFQPQRIPLATALRMDTLLLVYTPVSWLVNPATQYPVVIDPVVTTQNFLGVASITGTKFGAVCWTNSCDYSLTVPTPANSTVTNIYASFEYGTGSICELQDGGFSIDFGACHFPATAPGVITCPLAGGGNCGIINNTTLPDFQACLPVPSCVPQNLNFDLHFYRCNNDPTAVCGSGCIFASQPWIMIIEGRTLELISITPAQQICEGTSANINVNAQYGVGPYNYTWVPAAANNDTIQVSPAVTTTYTVTVTDACGTTGSLSSQLTVTTATNPGFTISQNPACVGENITLFGGGVFPASNYDWTVPGSNAPGGVISNTKQPIIAYALPGVYPVTLSFPGGSCIFDSTLTITITAPDSAEVALSTFPASAICPGDTMRFYATATNGGSAPTYDWLVDGVQVLSGPADSLLYSNLNNGSLVQVVIHSNSSCASPLIDTASVFVNVTNAVSPQVSISPDTAVCPGSPVTFTATPVNGGGSPAYQWSLNGTNVFGATLSTFTATITSTDTVVGVVMTSSLGCVATPTDLDTVHVALIQPVTPTVSLSPNPAGAVCPGDQVVFTANPVNGGAAPSYQWFVNGIAAGAASGTAMFTLTTPANHDSVSVLMTSSNGCVLTSTATSFSMVTVTPAALPNVVLNVAPSASVCSGDTLYFTASATGAGSTPGYSWFVNGIVQPDTDSLFSSHTLNSGDVVTAIVTSSLSCALAPSDTDSVSVTVTPTVAPTISIAPGSTGLCQGAVIQFVATTGNGGASPVFSWTLNGVATGSNNDTISLSVNDGDVLQATMTSSSACATTPVVTSNNYLVALNAYVTPSVSISANPAGTLCIGQSVTFTAQPLNEGTSPVYQWTVNGIPAGTNSTTLQSTTFQQGDLVAVMMTSSMPCLTQAGDTSNILSIVSYPPLNVQVLGSVPVCPGTPVVLTAQGNGGDGGPYSYVWTESILDTSSITVAPLVSTTYHVSVHDGCGTTPDLDSVRVQVLPGPQANYSFLPQEPSSFNNTVSFSNLSLNASSWTWYFSDGDTTTVRNPVHTFVLPGTYQVILVTKSSNGCYDTLVYNLVVKEDIAYFIPSAFSPNDDLVNETWSPIGISLGDYEFTIWDRWGEKIFSGDKDHPWDGHVQKTKSPAHDGVYIYRVDLKDSKFEKKVVTGRVTLIR